jgi:hypothetical protein
MSLSTFRFVSEAVRQRRARHRLRDFIILALRTLAVVLLAVAVARPRFGQQPLISDIQAGDAVRVVILDASQSMAATDGGVELLERGRAAAAGYLRYRRGLQANLIQAASGADATFDEPSTNFEALRDDLSRAEVRPERLDVNGALELAAQMLARVSETDARRRELVVISDFQRSNWAAADFGLLPAETQIQLESVRLGKPLDNVAILRATCRGRSQQGGGVPLEIEIGNYSSENRTVEVEVDIGQSTFHLKADCPAGRRTVLSDLVQFQRPGWQTGVARLLSADDALAADDRRPLAVQVRQEPVYAILTRQPATARHTSSYYLHYALVPERETDESTTTHVIRLDPAAADRETLGPADLIVVDHPGKLSEQVVSLLAGLMRRGRPLIYVASELTDATNLKRLADAAGSSLKLPVEFVPPPAEQLRRDLFLAAIARDRFPFRVFGETAGAVASQLRFAGGLSSRRQDSGLVDDVLATYSDGSACLVHSACDLGSLAVINADLAASNLPTTDAFVPLLRELADHMLQSRRGDEAAVCGELLVAQLPAELRSSAGLVVARSGADAEVGAETPAEKEEEVERRYGELLDEPTGVVWRWASPTQPGAYRVVHEDATVYAKAVSVPAEESQLEAIPPAVFMNRLAAGRDLYIRDAAGGSEQNDDIWSWLLAVCILCILTEVVALVTTSQ